MNVRFAPSPTGKMHIGNFRTLIFVYLFANFNNLKLICRIDDTDLSRNNCNSLQNILLVLHIFMIQYYCYNQLTQINKCNKYLEYLVKNNFVYRCVCVNRTNCECVCKNYSNGAYVLKAKEILGESVVYNDKIYGKICFNHINDIVIFRSNKIPLYNFVTVVCDIQDNISVVIRGCEHIVNTWQQIAIYKSLNANLPEFLHLSIVCDSNNKKLSKRSDSVISIIDLIKMGYLRSAIKNYVVLLGLNTGNNEYFNVENIKDFFKYENFHKTNAKYSIEKLTSINKKHLQNLDSDVLLDNLNYYFMLNNVVVEKINFDYLPKDLKRYSLLSQIHYDLDCLSGNYYNINITQNINYLKQQNVLEIFKQILNLLQTQQNIIEILESVCLKFDKKIVHKIFRVLTINVYEGINSNAIIGIIGTQQVIKRINCYKKIIINDFNDFPDS